MSQILDDFTKKFEELSQRMSRIEKQLKLQTTTSAKTTKRSATRPRRR